MNGMDFYAGMRKPSASFLDAILKRSWVIFHSRKEGVAWRQLCEIAFGEELAILRRRNL